MLRSNFVQTAVIQYDNWLPGAANSIADLNIEVEKIRKVTVGWKDYCVFAKSIGVALSLKSIKEKVITPRKCVFVGTPVLWTRQNNIDLDSWIEDFKTPMLFIQQESPSGKVKQPVGESNPSYKIENLMS